MTERKGMKTGCIVAASVVAGLVLVCGGVLSYCGYKVANNPQVQHGIALMGSSMEIGREAALAPGTAPMRAAGCTQALVLSPSLIRRFYEAVVPDGGTIPDPPATPLLVCNASASRAPECADVVRAYAASQTIAGDVGLQVNVPGESTARCNGTFASDGTRIGEIDLLLGSVGEAMVGRRPRVR